MGENLRLSLHFHPIISYTPEDNGAKTFDLIKKKTPIIFLINYQLVT